MILDTIAALTVVAFLIIWGYILLALDRREP